MQGDLGAGTLNLNQKGGINLGGTTLTTTTVSGPTEVRRTANGGNAALTNQPANMPSEKSDTLAQVFNPFGTASEPDQQFRRPMTDLSRGIAALPGTPGVTAQDIAVEPEHAVHCQQHRLLLERRRPRSPKKYGVVTNDRRQPDQRRVSPASPTVDRKQRDLRHRHRQLGAGKALPTLSTTNANVLYDFVDATELRFAGAWNASILAPLATITSMGGAINGSVVVASMTQSQSLNVGNVFNGDLSGLNTVSFRRVPEPASLAMLAVGVAGAAAARRRRRA